MSGCIGRAGKKRTRVDGVGTRVVPAPVLARRRSESPTTASRLARALAARCGSQSAAARQLGVSQGTYNGWCRARHGIGAIAAGVIRSLLARKGGPK